MLCRTAIHLRYASLRSFFEDHLPCLLKYWIENGYDFQDFPYQLLDYDSPTTFCRYIGTNKYALVYGLFEHLCGTSHSIEPYRSAFGAIGDGGSLPKGRFIGFYTNRR